MNTVNLTHLKTIYKGCTPDGAKADPSKSYIIRFTWDDAHSHATLMSMLSPAFLHAQQNADECVSNNPFHISIIWPFETYIKRKIENKETAYDALVWFVENMLDPKNGAIVSIYRCSKQIAHQGEQWRHSQIWPLKQQWSPQRQYISVHKAESGMSKRRIDKVKHQESVYLPLIEFYANKYGYEIKYVDYTLTVQEIVDVMVQSDWHFCYSGATMYTAAMIGIPTLAWHELDNVENNLQKWRDYDDSQKVNYTLVQETPWGLMSTNPGKIKQYIFENERVETRPLTGNRHIETKEDILNTFLRMIK